MACVPGARAAVDSWALPVVPRATVRMATPPSLKVTFPPGTSDPLGCATLAVNVTFSPEVDGFDDETMLVTVTAWLSRTDALFEPAFAVTMSRAPSPLTSPTASADG